MVKWFHSGMPGAPVIANAWGDMTAALDACLATGFNVRTALSLTRVDDVATATFGAGHGYVAGSVLRIAGCDQAAYNGDFRVIGATLTTVSFRVSGTPATPATTSSSITARVAPLGFDIVWSDVHKRVYRSPNPASNRPYLRVHDALPVGYTTTWAKFARVTMAAGMSDIDTFVGARAPYEPTAPTRNEEPSGSGSGMYSGWFKWVYGRSDTAETGDGGSAPRSWVLIGDDRGFYLACPVHTYAWGPDRILYAFGDFDSFRPNDAVNAILFAAERYAPVGTYSTHAAGESHSTTAGNSTGKVVLGAHTQIGNGVRVALSSIGDPSTETPSSGQTATFVYPNGPDQALLAHPIYLRETGNHLRGRLPGILWVPQANPVPHLTEVTDVIGYAGRRLLYVGLSGASPASDAAGFLFDIEGPWR